MHIRICRVLLCYLASMVHSILSLLTHIFCSVWVFFHAHSRFTGQQGKGEGIYLTSLYHFHPLHRHLGISRAITAESSPLHIASSLQKIIAIKKSLYYFSSYRFIFSHRQLLYFPFNKFLLTHFMNQNR